MPQWCAEFLAPDCLVPGGAQVDISQFGYSDAQTLTVVAGAVVAGTGVSITLDAPLVAPIVVGQVLDFGEGELFTLTVRAERGERTLVGDLAADLEGGETYDYPGVSGRTVVPEGILIGRTYAERDAGTGYGPADLAADEEIFIVAFANDFVEQDAGITRVRHDHHIYENQLPDWDSLDAAGQAKVRELYDCLTLPVNN